MAISIDIFDQLWYLDFEANIHMSPLKHLFNNYTPLILPKFILLRDNSLHIAQDIRFVNLYLKPN